MIVPLRLVGCNIYDANGYWIALLRDERAEYRVHGEQIVAAVNSRVDYALLEMKYATLLAEAKEALKLEYWDQDGFEPDAAKAYSKLRAAIEKAEAM